MSRTGVAKHVAYTLLACNVASLALKIALESCSQVTLTHVRSASKLATPRSFRSALFVVSALIAPLGIGSQVTATYVRHVIIHLALGVVEADQRKLNILYRS